MAYALSIKRAYEAPAKEDGFRILVDSAVAQGHQKEALGPGSVGQGGNPFCLKSGRPLATWRKGLRPSAAPTCRSWPGTLRPCLCQNGGGHPEKEPVTLVYAAKSSEINHARVLVEWLDGQMGGKCAR